MGEFKVGDKVVFCRGKKNSRLSDITVGKIYTIEEADSYLYVIDDADDYHIVDYKNSLCKPTKIIE